MRLWRRRPPVIPGAEVGKLRDETSVDVETGAVTSRQAGDIVLPAEAIEGLWDPEHLERVARTYWTTLQRFTLGLLHVHYTAGERAVVFVANGRSHGRSSGRQRSSSTRRRGYTPRSATPPCCVQSPRRGWKTRAGTRRSICAPAAEPLRCRWQRARRSEVSRERSRGWNRQS